MEETRSTIILIGLAKKLRQETGDSRYRARAEDEQGNLRTLIYISCTRPLCTLHFSLTSGIHIDQTSRFIAHGTDGADYQRKLATFFLRDQIILRPTSQIWVGFAWGILYCLIESIGPIFKNIHGFNQGQIGLAFLGIVYVTFSSCATMLEANIASRIGSFLGFWTNLYQERLYQ
jgi:hypothetical protein